jgi:hypothetical protein
MSCEVPSDTFVSAEYNLAWGEDLYARVEAVNIYGTSLFSASSLPAIIMRVPAPPTNLRERTAFRSFTTLSFDWDNGVSNYGSPIIDYTVSVAVGPDSTDFQVLSSIVLLKNFIHHSLTISETYKYRV